MTLLRHGRHRLHRTSPRRAPARARGRHLRARPRGLAREARRAAWSAGARPDRDQAGHRRPRRAAPRRRRGPATLKGKVDHFFHLAAIYDMAADEERNAALNVGGTQNAVDLANELEAGTFHHMSSIAVAGLYDEGTFTEDMFDEGQKLAHPYHRTKFESEKLVREQVKAPWRVYRPAIVVGDSRTGEMDKIDGPYYFFKVIQKVRARAAGVVPAGRPRVGLDQHRPGRLRRRRDRPHRPPGRPRRPGVPRRRPEGPARRRRDEHVRRGRPRAARRSMRIDKRVTRTLPKGVLSLRDEAAGAQGDPRAVPGRPRHPRRGRRVHRADLPLRRARHPARAARARASSSAAGDLRREAVGLLGAHARPRPVQGPLVRGRGQRQDGGHHRRLVAASAAPPR